MSDLKPCPFCGSNACVLAHGRLNGPTLYKIVCSSKKCRGHDHVGNVGAWLENGWRESREIAAQIWNRRAERTCRADLTETNEPANINTWECSLCGKSFEEAYGSYEYCPHCGARIVDE